MNETLNTAKTINEPNNPACFLGGVMPCALSHGSLFSGIGGFDLAAEWMGWENKFHCEWNDFGQKVLNHYWPNAESFNDITKANFKHYANRIDVLTGGFPCQPYSQAGKRLGKADDRHLWPEMLRAIQEIAPKYIVGENVYGIVNWNGGLVFGEVQADLEAEGYEVQPVILPAVSVNAPHRRDRVWFVAHRNSGATRPPGTSGETESNGSKNNDEPKSGRKPTEQHSGCGNVQGNFANTESNGSCGTPNETSQEIKRPNRAENEQSSIGSEIHSTPTTNTNGFGRGGLRNESETARTQESDELLGSERGISDRERNDVHTNGQRCRKFDFSKKSKKQKFITGADYEKSNDWKNFPTQPPVCGGDDGFSYQLDGITFSKWRNESIKAYGNAIVPQVAFEIFKVIHAMDAKAKIIKTA